MRVRRKLVAVSALLVFLAALVVLMSTTNQNATISFEDPRLEKKVVELQEKLHKAENLNRQYEDEMYAVLTKIGHERNNSVRCPTCGRGFITKIELYSHLHTKLRVGTTQVLNLTNWSITHEVIAGLQVPSIYSYLPHLTGHPEYLRPAVRLSKGRQGVSIVFGIPTIKRPKESYLIKTLSSLIGGLSRDESEDCLIVVFIAEPWDKQYSQQVIASIRENFSPSLESGLLDVIVPKADFYPNLDNLKENFGDTKERVKWRTKQNLDYAYHMLYSRPKATYYVQLEDDVMAKPDYLNVMKTFAHEQKEDWIMLEFSALGFIGKLFKSSDVPTVVEFFLMFHSDKPIDWLMDHLLWVKVCSPEKDVKHCQRMIQSVRRRYKPSLFQHIGMESSLPGKVQKLKDRDFGKSGLYIAHANPPAELSTSLKTYQKFILSKAYAGETFFWASNPSKGDTIDFKFNPPIHVDMYLFRSGHMDHPGDIFQNSTIEIVAEEKISQSTIDTLVSKGGLSKLELNDTSEGFIPIGRFDDAGLAKGEVPQEVGSIQMLRIHVHEKSNAWVILSEIMIQESKT